MSDNKRRIDRIGEERLNSQGCLMRIIEYYNTDNIIVEFQDEYKAKVKTDYQHYKSGKIKNPYYSSVYGIGIMGNKYPCNISNKEIKEHKAWHSMLQRCFSRIEKKRYPSYKNVTCCKEWLLYENFYEWLHSQENFDKWLNGDKWAIDKDIIIKGNKVYSPDTCCLVPNNVNQLFVKNDINRNDLPIGVSKIKNKYYYAQCKNPFVNKQEYLGSYNNPKDAFQAYKKRKEEIIKQVAQEEYAKGNIAKRCYEAMMNYEVEITD